VTAIRPARLGDALSVAQLEEVNLGVDAWPFGLVAQGVAGDVPTTHWWVAEGVGGLVGHAVVSVAAEIAELQRISVTDEARRTGVASALLDAVVGASADEGAEQLLLEVRVDNVGARAFYTARGFAEIARRPRYYTDGATALVMSRDLSR
jgi:[ribosomal protein S18]-alanine N-acetyltransferase